MQVIEIKHKKAWNKFVISNGDQFLQSWEWAEFQKKLGKKIWRLGIKYNDIVGQALIVKHALPLGKSYLYCPRGPIFNSLPDKEVLKLFFTKIKKLAQKHRAIFLRIEPFQDLGFKILDLKRVKDIQPSNTAILDISRSEEKILSNMHEKTRYNIRLAQRRGVKVRESNNIKTFLSLIHQTSKREKFKPHSDHYYQTLLAHNNKFVRIYAAEYKGEILAVHMMIFFGSTAAYIHGASSRKYKNVMAPHLLHWHTMQESKKQGYSQYDFWGIDEKKWPGLTRFKKGFGGKIINYPGTFDILINNFWYQLYKIGISCRSYLQ